MTIGLLAAITCTANISMADPQDNLTAEEWQAELRYMAEKMPEVHKNLFHKMTRQQFEQAVERLHARIPSLTRHGVIVEMARIVALINDGHTRIDFTRDAAIGFRRLPLRLYLYEDGLYVHAAATEYAHAVGARVVRIGNVSAEDAAAAVGQVVSYDNEMMIKDVLPHRLVIPEILHALGLVDQVDAAEFVVVDSRGKEHALSLSPVTADADIAWVDVRSDKTPAPLWLRDPANAYWHEYLPESRTMYLQYNAVTNKADEPLADYVKRLFQEIESAAVDRLIIDLRLNQGGNNFLNWPLIYAIIRSDKINQRGRLFAIVGRATFSAAMNCANALEHHTKVLFVGEPTGASPNHYGDATRLVLPKSGISVYTSTLYWQDSYPWDERPSIEPFIAAEPTFASFRDNQDPAMEAILNYDPEQELAPRLDDALSLGDVKEAIRRYHSYREKPENKYVDTERTMNRFGYRLLGMERYQEAIQVFELNVEAYPASFNVYDSLGEAYLKNGDVAAAVRNYEKTLQLNPNNPNAEAIVKKHRAK